MYLIPDHVYTFGLQKMSFYLCPLCYAQYFGYAYILLCPVSKLTSLIDLKSKACIGYINKIYMYGICHMSE